MLTARITQVFYGSLLAFSMISAVQAGQSMEEIQKQLNAETLTRPFSVPDDATLTASLKAATERGTPTKTRGYSPGCTGLGCALGYGHFGYGSYFGGYARPYYGGYYGGGYLPYYYGW
jgi:hypothetical protein